MLPGLGQLVRFDQLLLAPGEESLLAVRLASHLASVVVCESLQSAYSPLHLAIGRHLVGVRRQCHIGFADDLRGEEVRQLAISILAHGDVLNISFLLSLMLAAWLQFFSDVLAEASQNFLWVCRG